MNADIQAEMAEVKKKNIAETVSEYGKRLFGFIRSKVRTEEDAEDLLQDVWYQLSSISDFMALESVSGWLYKVAGNKITDYYRKKRTIPLENFAHANEEGEINFKEIILLDESDPDEAMFKEIFREELMDGLDELPANQREVFILHKLEEMSLLEIADKQNENIKTIISRKGYAVKHLRKRLQNLYNEFNSN